MQGFACPGQQRLAGKRPGPAPTPSPVLLPKAQCKVEEIWLGKDKDENPEKEKGAKLTTAPVKKSLDKEQGEFATKDKKPRREKGTSDVGRNDDLPVGPIRTS
jgi:hypothetical protein